MIFLSCGQLMRKLLIELFHLFSLLQISNDSNGRRLSSLATSYVVMRGSASVMLSVIIVNFRWLATALIIKALISFAELLETLLHCTFVSSSWIKCVVDVSSCLCCFTIHFELK